MWDGRDENGQDVANGLYLSHLEVPGSAAATHKMMRLPNGFSHLSTLDTTLQAQQRDWSGFKEDLVQPPGAEFGLAARAHALPLSAMAGGALDPLQSP